MKLYDPETEEEFEVPQHWPSGEKRRQLVAIQREHTEQVETIRTQYADILALHELGDQERTRQLTANPVFSTQAFEMNAAIVAATDRQIWKICQASLNVRHLDSAHCQLVESDVDGPFWQKQNADVVEEHADRFSLLCKGRRAAGLAIPASTAPQSANGSMGLAGQPGESTTATPAANGVTGTGA